MAYKSLFKILSILIFGCSSVRSFDDQEHLFMTPSNSPIQLDRLPQWKVVLDKHWDASYSHTAILISVWWYVLGSRPLSYSCQRAAFSFTYISFELWACCCWNAEILVKSLKAKFLVSSHSDVNSTWLSSLVDGGDLKWSKTQSNDDGQLHVSFRDIRYWSYKTSTRVFIRETFVRWSSLRSTEGWSILQHHNVLKTSLTVYPQAIGKDSASPRLLVYLKQGSFFALLPRETLTEYMENMAVKWHVGNIYEMERAPPNSVEFPVLPSLTKPTIYDLFVSGDYEVDKFCF